MSLFFQKGICLYLDAHLQTLPLNLLVRRQERLFSDNSLMLVRFVQVRLRRATMHHRSRLLINLP